MIVLLAVAIGTGIATALALIPIGPVTALLVAPVVASLSALLAGIALASRAGRHAHPGRPLEAQTGVMVAALRDVVQRTERPSPAPKVAPRRRGT